MQDVYDLTMAEGEIPAFVANGLIAHNCDNSFTLIGAHFDFVTQKTVVTTCIEVMTHDNRRIDFNLMYLHVILPVLKDLNAVVLLADQWQSLDILSRARQDMGLAPVTGKEKPRCATKQYSPRRKDFDSLVSMVENGAMELPILSKADYDSVVTEYIDYRTLNNQPVKHLFLQMLTVKDGGEGKCPEKGEGFTDDIFRALVLATKLHDEKILERLQEADTWVVIEVIIEEYRSRPIELKQVASGYRFQIKTDLSRWVSRLFEEKPPKYSRALLETLAIITYRQPVTRADIEDIRGVSVSSSIIQTLLEREWIRVVGHKEAPGRPGLYGTTKQFLDYFNVTSLSELPALGDIKHLEELVENKQQPT